MKKLFIAISVLVVLCAAGGYYWYSIQVPDVVSEPVDAIPPSASLIISYPDINQLWDVFEEKDYYEALFPIEELERYYSRNLILDSLIRYNQDLKPLLDGSEIWSSYHAVDSDSIQVLYAFKPTKNDFSLLNKLNLAFTNSGLISSLKVNGKEALKFVAAEPFDILFITVTNGLVLATNSESLLSESLSHLQSGTSLTKDALFNKAYSSAGKNVEANIYLNYQVLPFYVRRALKSTLPNAKQITADFASWTELDVLLKDNDLTFNGFTHTNDTLNQYLNLFLDQKPREIEFPEYLPANTSSFVFYGIEDLISFVADYRNMLSAKGTITQLEATIDSIGKTYEIDIEQNILGWIGKSYGLFVTEPKSTTFAEQSFWMFESSSGELAAKLLADLGSAINSKNGNEPFESDFNGVKIKQLQLDNIVVQLLGDGYQNFANPYYIVIDNYVVFGTSENALQKYLQYIQADRRLSKELSFSRFVENLGSSYNIFTYHHLSKSTNIFKSYFNQKAIDAIDNNAGVISDFEALGTQITSTGQSFYSNVFLKYNPDWKDTEETSWKAQLDAEVQGTPLFVKNHISNETEILVQDKSNQLYLFNAVGQELFKRELPEAIQSKPKQVDAFKNGKLQYVFNTNNFVYLIDRNGKDVSGFPIELESPAETDLGVIEYDNNREYRLLIACKNKRIYNYNVSGKRIKGWKHNKAKDPTIHKFKHLFVNSKDYIITGESNGKIHLLDRRGKNRVRVQKRIKCSKNNELTPFKSKKSALTGVYLTDTDGLIHKVALSGSVSSIDLGKFSKNHKFLITDLDGDELPEFVFFDLNLLQVFDHRKQKVFETRIEPEAKGPTVVDLDGKQKALGFHYANSEQLVAFDIEGKSLSGFPLSGNSMFDIDSATESYRCVSAGPNSNLLIQTIE